MTKEEILEGNKLIAEFLGYVYVPYTAGHSGRPCGWIIKNYKLVDRKVPKLFLGRTTKDLLYHKSWDWLMPVVEKINFLDHLNLWDKHNIDKFNLTESIANVDIERTYELIVEFIEWYNEECAE